MSLSFQRKNSICFENWPKLLLIRECPFKRGSIEPEYVLSGASVWEGQRLLSEASSHCFSVVAMVEKWRVWFHSMLLS